MRLHVAQDKRGKRGYSTTFAVRASLYQDYSYNWYGQADVINVVAILRAQRRPPYFIGGNAASSIIIFNVVVMLAS